MSSADVGLPVMLPRLETDRLVVLEVAASGIAVSGRSGPNANTPASPGKVNSLPGRLGIFVTVSFDDSPRSV